MSQITIRPLRRTDAPAVAKMLRALAVHHGDKAVVDASFLVRNCLGARKRAYVWVAVVDRKAVGFILAYDTVNFVKKKLTSRVDLLYVEKKYRRKGIAKLLIAAVAKDALTRGISRLAVSAMESNKESNRFYVQCGFRAREARTVKYSVEGSALKRMSRQGLEK